MESDYVGKTFGRLTITAYRRASDVDAVCKCGSAWHGRIYPLLKGETKSCGCLLVEARKVAGTKNKRHGMDGTPEYRAWVAMRARCSNSKHKGYSNYGGRGISVCEEWQTSFEKFYSDMGPRPGPAYSLDRVDNDSGYTAANCRWTTKKEQANNVRRNRVYVFFGELLTISEAANRFQIRYGSLKARLDKGIEPDVAASTPVRAWRRRASGGAPRT